MLGEKRHGFELRRARRFVDDHLQSCQLALHERPRQQVQARRINRSLENGMTRAIEADEFTARSAMNDIHVDSRSRRRAVDRSNLQLPPRTTIVEHDAADARRWEGRVLRVPDRGAGEDSHVVNEIDDGRASGHDIAIRGRREEWFEHDRRFAPFDAHRRAVHGAVLGDRGDNGLDDHTLDLRLLPVNLMCSDFASSGGVRYPHERAPSWR